MPGGGGFRRICIGHPMTLSQEEYEECRLAFNKFGTGCVAIGAMCLRKFVDATELMLTQEKCVAHPPLTWAHALMLACPCVCMCAIMFSSHAYRSGWERED